MSSGNINPIKTPQAWDYITIGGINSPGMCKLGDVKRKHDFDRKKGKGTVGETITFTQKPAAEFTVTFYLWLEEHFTEWDEFREHLKYDPTKKEIQAIEIYHPSLLDLEIHSVVTASLGAIKHEGKQMYSIKVDFLEYFPASKTSAVSTPTGSNQNADPPNNKKPGTPPNNAQDELDKEAQQALTDLTKAYQ